MDSKLVSVLEGMVERADQVRRLETSTRLAVVWRSTREELLATIATMGREAAELLRTLRATAPAALVDTGQRSDACPDADWRDGAEVQ